LRNNRPADRKGPPPRARQSAAPRPAAAASAAAAGPGALRAEARRLHGLFVALARRRPLRDPVAAACEGEGLTGPQIHALLWLGHDGALTMGALARRLDVTEKTITGVVDRLERAGWAARARDAADRRVIRAALTPAGEALFGRIEETAAERLGHLLALLDPPDRAALFRILERVNARLAAQEGTASAAPLAKETEEKT
jgi:DNA-binding MarR family transcriptional regulator